MELIVTVMLLKAYQLKANVTQFIIKHMKNYSSINLLNIARLTRGDYNHSFPQGICYLLRAYG